MRQVKTKSFSFPTDCADFINGTDCTVVAIMSEGNQGKNTILFYIEKVNPKNWAINDLKERMTQVWYTTPKDQGKDRLKSALDMVNSIVTN